MKISAEVPYANECLLGKPVKIDGKVVGKVVSVEGNKVTSDIYDLKTYKRVVDGKVPGYSIGISEGLSKGGSVYA